MNKIILTILTIFSCILNAEVDSFSTKLNLKGTNANLFNGAVSEHIINQIYKKNGYSQLDAEVGRNGVDGLFVRRDLNGKIKNIIFVEVKHGDGKLGYIKNPKNMNRKIKQMSKEWKLIKLDKKIKSLEKGINSQSPDVKKQIEELKYIKREVKRNSSIVKSNIVRVENEGNDKYKISFNELKSNGKPDKRLKHTFHDKKIDLNKQYRVGSEDWKLQKIMKHSVRKEKRILKEKSILKKLKNTQKKYKKGSAKYRNYTNSIKKQKAKMKMINKSRPKIFKKGSNTPKIEVPAIINKKGKKVLAFMDAQAFKNASKLKNMKFLKNVKVGDVVMMAIESGVAVYTVLHGGMTYKKVSQLLLNNTRDLAGQGFSKGLAFITPPPAILIVITSVAGAMIVEYSIDKYIELDKRSYVGLEDMLWNVPDEIKNKINILNLEDTKSKTLLDFGDIDKETILDDEVEGKTFFEDINNKKTILDY